MIVRITGILLDVTEEAAIVERDGVAWEVLAPAFAIGELAAHRGQEVTLHTLEFYEGNQASGHLIPRLMGFLHKEDKGFFHHFISVKGIGPRKALKALNQPVRRIALWVESGDAKQVAGLPGIGKRGAELIVATLKGKLKDLAMPGELSAADGGSAESAKLTPAQRDALEVLVAWGDSRADALRWVERAAQLFPDAGGADEWVRLAYRVKTGGEA